VKLETPGGKVLWKLNGVPAGDTDTRIPVPLEDGELDVTLEVRFGHPAGDTAVFLTIAPDGLEEETRYAIGSEHVEEPLTFSWPGR
jgi:hypothetical protein